MKHAALGGVITLLAGHAQAQTFAGLGSLPDAVGVLPRAVTNKGTVVVGQASIAGNPVAWRWSVGEGMQALGFTGYAFAVNADGTVIAGDQGTFPSQAVRWMEGGPQGLGYLVPSHTSSSARGISADGAVIVGRSLAGTTESVAFRWTPAGGMVGLGMLSGFTHSLASGVSLDGSVVAGTCYLAGGNSLQQAFRYVDGIGMTGLGSLPGRNSSGAAAVSGDGSTIVGAVFNNGSPGTEPFRWTTSGGMHALGFLPGFATCTAVSVSGDGQVVVGSCGTTVSDQFVWTAAGGMRSLGQALTDEFGLNLAGWSLTSVQAISPDGCAIVGTGINPGGVLEPFLAVLPGSCYPNCDGSTVAPALNANDFVCFLNRFTAQDPYANCDGSTATPSLTGNDFVCFLSAFVSGCS